MEYEPTLSSAINFSKINRLEEWLHLFLCKEGNNKAFSEGLKLEPRRYYAPKLFELSKFTRCCGPEKNMKYQVDNENFIKRVNKIVDKYLKGDWDMPPLIINRNGKNFELNDGNHRYEALKKMRVREYWIIIWETINNNGENY